MLWPKKLERLFELWSTSYLGFFLIDFKNNVVILKRSIVKERT